MRRLLRLDRTDLGPRVYLLGWRVHEWQLGIGLLLVLGVGGLLHRWGLTGLTALAGLAGSWLVIKDWRDVSPRTRDIHAWRVGLHRLPAPLRPCRRGDWLPPLAGAISATVAVVSLLGALDPGVGLMQLPPITAVPAVHAFVLPAAGALLVASIYLTRRRRRAHGIALAVLLALGAAELLRGLQVDDALLAFGAAALLLWGRDSFYVRQEPITLRSTLWRIPLLALAASALAGVAVSAAAPGHASPGAAVRETADLLLWSAGPLTFHDGFGWLPYGVGAVSLTALLAGAYVLFRPLAASRGLPDVRLRLAARELVRVHGSDTLSFFNLRQDKQYLFSPDGQAFVAYRIENGVLLLSGDPVGPSGSLPALVSEVCALADRRGLRVGGVGAGNELLGLWRQAGLRSLYVGDEAIVETSRFNLEGRPIRKVRQSVARLVAAGYVAELRDLGSLEPDELDALEAVSSRWRGGAAERGFSMAMDSLRGDHLADSVVVIARDAAEAIRGYVHFVPVYRRPAVSLSQMRRDRNTPNGLMEFLVVRAIEALRERGVEEVSLNFAAFARWMHSPRSRTERVLGRIASLLNPWFQIESLYRFNAKFFPRWEPRYVLYESPLAFLRTGLAVLWAEGQLPRPRLRLVRGL